MAIHPLYEEKQMNENNIDVALTLDNNYVVPISVLITSILENLDPSRSVTFHMIVSGFTDKEKSTINKLKTIRDFEVIYYDAEKYIHLFSEVNVSSFKNKYINLVCYYRLLLFKIIPPEVKKIFYIDGDIIVNTDLARIYDTVDDKLAALVVEVIAMTFRKEGLKHLQNYEEFDKFNKNPMDFPYYNAGFELINLDKARQYNMWDRAWDFFHKHPNPPYADQDIINAIMGQEHRDEIYILGPEYNVFCTNDIDHKHGHDDAFYPRSSTIEAYANPKILHYAGPDKPWINGRCYYYNIWWDYAKKTPIQSEIINVAQLSLLKLTKSKNQTNNSNQSSDCITRSEVEWSRKLCISMYIYLTLAKTEKIRKAYEEYLRTQPPQKPGKYYAIKSYIGKIKTLIVLNLRKDQL